MLVYLQQNWIKDQHQLQETLSTITIEKARIEEDTNSWTFPRNVTSTTATITAASSLRGRGYEVVLQKVLSEANPKFRNHGEGPY